MVAVGAGGDPEAHAPAVRRWHGWAPVACVVAYAVLALAAYWPVWPGDPHRLVSCSCGDPSEAAWFLAWPAHAILHGINPFFTTAINHPAGINLAVNTEMPLLGLVAAPVTLSLGPVASLNLLMWMAYPLSAASMLFVLRRWTRWYPAAFVGGLLYGFSPYVIGQGRLHLQLVFVPLPPLIVLAVLELFVRRGERARRWGLVLGALVTAQFFISTEVLASTFVVVVVGLAVLAATHVDAIAVSVRAAMPGLVAAAAVTAVFLAYPVWILLFGPQRYVVPVWVLNLVSGRSGLLSPFSPTRSMWFAPTALSRFSSTTPGFADTVENGTYLSVPLVLLVAYFAVRFRSNRWLRFAVVMALASFVLTLGPHLDVGGNRTSIALPFALIERIPSVGLINPIRMALFVSMFASMAVALGMDESWRAVTHSPGRTGGANVDRRRRIDSVVIVFLLASSAFLLLPRWPVATTPADVPPYFTSPAVDLIPPGDTVLMYPYPVPGRSDGMLWQALAGMRFDLLGSYALHPSSHGYASQFPDQLAPAVLQRLFYREEGVAPPGGGPIPVGTDRRVAAARLFLRQNRVGTVLVAQRERNAGAIAGIITRAVGPPSRQSEGVDAWYGVQLRLRRWAPGGP